MRENLITEIGVDNFEARLPDREIEVLASIRDWLETFPLRAGERMWCIGVGGVANNKPFTGDVDIRIFLQLGDEPAPQNSAPYSAMYERFKDYILKQLQISSASLDVTITSPESEKSSPYLHPHILKFTLPHANHTI